MAELHRTHKSVLVIDDNSGDTLLLQEAFKRVQVDLQVDVLSDGPSALSALASGECQTPRFILLDLKLPRMNGLEVLQKLKEDSRFRSIPVIVLSSSQSPKDISEAYLRHCNAYIRKPSDFTKLVQLTRLLVDFWLDEVLNHQLC